MLFFPLICRFVHFYVCFHLLETLRGSFMIYKNKQTKYLQRYSFWHNVSIWHIWLQMFVIDYRYLLDEYLVRGGATKNFSIVKTWKEDKSHKLLWTNMTWEKLSCRLPTFCKLLSTASEREFIQGGGFTEYNWPQLPKYSILF